MSGIVLFDIDQTLLYTGGAGSAAMNQAFAEVFGIDDAFAKVEFHGRTDYAIFRDAFRLHRLDGREHPGLARFVELYLTSLDITLPRREGHLKPGIPLLLDALLSHGMALGLATGNFREGAMRKLRHYGIDAYFSGGGFGDATEDRSTVVRDALVEFGVSASAPREGGTPVYVVGDTPADVVSAKANGVFAVGVATGAYTVDELAEAGADVALPDLGDIERVLAALAELAG